MTKLAFCDQCRRRWSAGKALLQYIWKPRVVLHDSIVGSPELGGWKKLAMP